MKTIWCSDCGIKVGELAVGSLTRKKVVFYCDSCHTKIQALRLLKSPEKPVSNPFEDMFGEIWGKK